MMTDDTGRRLSAVSTSSKIQLASATKIAHRETVADTGLGAMVGFSPVRVTNEPCVKRQFRSRADIHKKTYSDGIAVVEELISFCDQLEAHRTEYAKRCAQSEVVIAELTTAFNETRAREKNHLAVLDSIRHRQARLQEQYIVFKADVKDEIRRLHDIRQEKLQVVLRKRARAEEHATILHKLKTSIDSKADELLLVEEQARNAPSTTELDNMQRRITALQRDNDELTKLISQQSKRARRLELLLGHDSGFYCFVQRSGGPRESGR